MLHHRFYTFNFTHLHIHERLSNLCDELLVQNPLATYETVKLHIAQPILFEQVRQTVHWPAQDFELHTDLTQNSF